MVVGDDVLVLNNFRLAMTCPTFFMKLKLWGRSGPCFRRRATSASPASPALTQLSIFIHAYQLELGRRPSTTLSRGRQSTERPPRRIDMISSLTS